MRKLGIGALAVIGGLLLALVVQDLLATAFLEVGAVPICFAIIIGLLLPALALLGLVAALTIDVRSHDRPFEKATDR